MNIDEIRKNAPKGATHHTDKYDDIIYFFKSKYGFRQIKDNVISFYDIGIPISEIKPL